MSAVQLATELSREAARRHAEWRPETFDAWVRETVALEERMSPGPGRERFAAAMLELCREGLAEGWLEAPRAERPATFFELCVRRLGAEPPPLDPPGTIRSLVDAFNLGGGLAREPRWMSEYVLSRGAELDSCRSAGAFLTRVLEPVLSASEPSSFSRDPAVTLLDLAPADDQFLPGELTLFGPCIVRVRDRRRDRELGVLLRHGRGSFVLGPLGDAGPAESARPMVQLALEGPELRVGKVKVALPLLAEPRDHLAVSAGFVVITAEDSQHLWIVECR